MKLSMTSITCGPLRTVPVLALIAGFAMFPGTAVGAAPVQQFHDHFTGSFSTDACGISVDVNFVLTDNFFLYADGSSRETFSVSETFTNPANGKTVTVSDAGQTTVQNVVVNEQANTVTFTVSNKGLPEKIQTPNGPVLSRDAGFLMRTLTFDLTTEDLISTAITANKGPHPEADSDFALFCELITAALS